MKKLLLILIPALIGIAAYYGYHEYNRKAVPVEELKAVNIFTPDDLYNEFKNNEGEANRRYLNKPVEVLGKVIATNVSDKGIITVELESGDPMGVVSCELDPTATHATTKPIVQDNLRIKGICTGYLTDVILTRCVILHADNSK